MSVETKSYSISTLHSLNSLLGSANLRHLTGDGGGELTDLSVGSAENRARNASSSKLGDGQHCSFFELFPPRVIMKRPPIEWIGFLPATMIIRLQRSYLDWLSDTLDMGSRMCRNG